MTTSSPRPSLVPSSLAVVASRPNLLLVLAASLAACAEAVDATPDGAAPPVDAPVSTVPRDPAGTFDVATTLDLPLTAAARPLLDVAQRATDGADDPMRYVLDLMIAELPDGTPKTLARLTAPFVAAYLSDQLADVAPRFVPGMQSLAQGLARVATHVELAETVVIDAGGAAVRTIRGARFDLVLEAPVLVFAAHGLADVTTATRVALDRSGGLTIDRHLTTLRHGALVRLGLDRAVIPTIEPRARDLASAFAILVDCELLGKLVATKLDLGSPGMYATACETGMNALAEQLYAQIAALDEEPLLLELAGSADGFDVDHDGTLDELRSGQWTGTVTASFHGARSR